MDILERLVAAFGGLNWFTIIAVVLSLTIYAAIVLIPHLRAMINARAEADAAVAKAKSEAETSVAAAHVAAIEAETRQQAEQHTAAMAVVAKYEVLVAEYRQHNEEIKTQQVREREQYAAARQEWVDEREKIHARYAEEIRAEREARETAMTALQSMTDSTEKRRLAFEKRIATMEAEITGLNASKVAMEAEIAELKSDNEAKDARITALQATLDGVIEAREKAEGERDGLLAELAELRKMVDGKEDRGIAA